MLVTVAKKLRHSSRANSWFTMLKLDIRHKTFKQIICLPVVTAACHSNCTFNVCFHFRNTHWRQWRTEGDARWHLLVSGGKRAKIVKKIHVKIQFVSFICVCMQYKESSFQDERAANWRPKVLLRHKLTVYHSNTVPFKIYTSEHQNIGTILLFYILLWVHIDHSKTLRVTIF